MFQVYNARANQLQKNNELQQTEKSFRCICMSTSTALDGIMSISPSLCSVNPGVIRNSSANSVNAQDSMMT